MNTMFLATDGYGRNAMGWIEVICGSMFSGKTEELILRIRRLEYAKIKWQIFKSAIDTKYSVDKIVSHGGRMLLAAAEEQVLLGAKDTYEARCRGCYIKGKEVSHA